MPHVQPQGGIFKKGQPMDIKIGDRVTVRNTADQPIGTGKVTGYVTLNWRGRTESGTVDWPSIRMDDGLVIAACDPDRVTVLAASYSEHSDRMADAYEELSDAVTSAVMKAERAGLSPQDVINAILGDLAVRPGYPADEFAPLIRDEEPCDCGCHLAGGQPAIIAPEPDAAEHGEPTVPVPCCNCYAKTIPAN